MILSDNEVLVQHGSRSDPSELLRDEDLSGIPAKVFSALLAGPRSAASLLASFDATTRSDAKALVTDLLERGIIAYQDESPLAQYVRYAHGRPSALEAQSVLLVGAGPLGARLADSLLKQGLGGLRVLDERQVNDTWVQLTSSDTVGQPRGVTAGEAVTRLLPPNTHDRVETLRGELISEGFRRAMAESDLTVVAYERPDPRATHLINRVAVQLKRPWILATIDGSLGQIGPCFVPPFTACYNDLSVLADATASSAEIHRQYRKHLLSQEGASFFPGLPSYVDVAAGYTGLAVSSFLLTGTCFLLNRRVVIDFTRLVIDTEDVLRLPRCPVCSATAPPFRPLVSPDAVVERRRYS